MRINFPDQFRAEICYPINFTIRHKLPMGIDQCSQVMAEEINNARENWDLNINESVEPVKKN
jgi:hypothetical protein